MTNKQIINRRAVEAGIYSKEEARDILIRSGELPLHTFAEWKNRGFIVKKGQHAALITRIWKQGKKTVDVKIKDRYTGEESEEQRDIERFYMTIAHFFRDDQVEPLQAR